MTNHKDTRKDKRSARKAFLRDKRKNASLTDKLLSSAPATNNSTLVMNIRDRTGGRDRKMRRG